MRRLLLLLLTIAIVNSSAPHIARAAGGNSPESDTPLPAHDDALFPPLNTAPAAPTAAAPAPAMASGAPATGTDIENLTTAQIKSRIQQLSNDLKEKQTQLETVRQ